MKKGNTVVKYCGRKNMALKKSTAKRNMLFTEWWEQAWGAL